MASLWVTCFMPRCVVIDCKFSLFFFSDYMDRFMDEAESHVSSRSASPYSQQNQVGNSSPVEMQTEKPDQFTSQLAHSKPASQHSMISSVHQHTAAHGSKPGGHHHLAPHRSHLSMTGQFTTGTHSQVIGPSSYMPSTFAHSKVAQSKHSLNHSPTKSSSHLKPFSSTEFSNLATITPGNSIHAVETTPVAASVEPVASVSSVSKSWSHDPKRPLIDPVVFNAGQGVYKLHTTSANQRSVTFGAGGYTTASISQSVE